MPLGRIYQAPAVATVSRNTPVYGYNGLKAVNNSDLVITGRAVRSKSSKSPSPASSSSTKINVKPKKSTERSVSVNKTVNRKSPSPLKSVKQNTSTASKNTKDTQDKEEENQVNNNSETVNSKSDEDNSGNARVNGMCNGHTTNGRDKSWSPEVADNNSASNSDRISLHNNNSGATNDSADISSHDIQNNKVLLKNTEDETCKTGNNKDQAIQVGDLRHVKSIKSDKNMYLETFH